MHFLIRRWAVAEDLGLQVVGGIVVIVGDRQVWDAGKLEVKPTCGLRHFGIRTPASESPSEMKERNIPSTAKQIEKSITLA